MRHFTSLVFICYMLASTSLDLTPGNLWNASLENEWERKFVAKLRRLSTDYDLTIWYDVMFGPHIYLRLLAPMWHLQAPMKLVYFYPDQFTGQNDADWNAQKDVAEAYNVAQNFPEERTSRFDIKTYLQESCGHLLITPNNPAIWGFEYDWTYNVYPGAPYYHQAYAIGHDDETAIYFGDASPGQRLPLHFAKYYHANRYKVGPLSRDDLVEAAGFPDRSKPLLVYLSTYDDFGGPDWDSEHGKRPSSVLFAQSARETTRKALFDLSELDQLSKSYNVVVRVHPLCVGDYASQDMLEQLRKMGETSKSLFVYAESNTSTATGLKFTDWYGNADVLVVELGATSTAAMVLANDKAIVFARRKENDNKLSSRGHKLITDKMVTGWRPQQEESLLEAVEEAKKQMVGDDAARVVKSRQQYNDMLYRCPLNGYEEYAMMLAILSRIWLGDIFMREVQELKEIYLRDEFEWCDALPRVRLGIYDIMIAWTPPFLGTLLVLFCWTCCLHNFRSLRPEPEQLIKSFASAQSLLQLSAMPSPPPPLPRAFN